MAAVWVPKTSRSAPRMQESMAMFEDIKTVARARAIVGQSAPDTATREGGIIEMMPSIDMLPLP